MSVLYKFYRPWDMSEIASGNFAGMPFDRSDCPKVMQVADSNSMYEMNLAVTGIMDRKMAEAFQSIMECNKTFFTDLMDEYDTDSLIYRIE